MADLADLEKKTARAVEAVNALGKAHADLIVARINAEARAKGWADLAYEMWALVVNSVHDGHGTPDAAALWEAQKNALRERLSAALDTMPEDVKP